MIPRVVDISHHNVGPLHGEAIDFKAVAGSGIWGVIHKASQGRAYVDPEYAVRRAAAVGAGLLWGAYHFNTGDDVPAQVANFVSAAKPGAGTLMVLDFEDNRLSNMSAAQAVQFLKLLEQRIGRAGAIYSGNRLKETIGALSPADRGYLAGHRLWLCQYGPHAIRPAGFAKWWLWQYTDGVVNTVGSKIPGIRGEVDLNTFDGTREQLNSTWA